MISSTPRLRRFILASFCGAPLAVAFPAVAGAAPNCVNSTAGNPNECCVQVGDAPGPGPNCVSNEGLLGDLPVLGNLPGLGGIL